jgi:hypothetical protein
MREIYRFDVHEDYMPHGTRVADASGVQTGAYETKGSRFIYKVNAAGSYAFASKDVSRIVNHGAFIALSDLSERLIGGDVYIKRALAATLLHANGNPDSNTSYSAGNIGQELDQALGNSLGTFNNGTPRGLPKQAFRDFALRRAA